MKKQKLSLHKLGEKQENTQDTQQMYIGWYFWLIAQHPILVIILCAAILTAFSVVGITFSNIPDFSDPSQGFEIRGTKLGDKLITWRKLLNKTGNNLPLSIYPYGYFRHKVYQKKIDSKRLTSKYPNARTGRIRRSPVFSHNYSAQLWDFVKDGYFCDNPKPKYANWVFRLESDDLASLWSLKGIQSICQHQKELLLHPNYENVCIRRSLVLCCPVISISNFVAYFARLNTCEDITQNSMLVVEGMLQLCAKYYCDGRLKADCWQSNRNSNACPLLPKMCTTYNAVFYFFHFMVENTVICPFSLNNSLKYSTLFLPAFKHRNLLPIYYDNFQSPDLSDEATSVSGIDFDLKIKVFEELLFSDTIYPLIAMVVVAVIISLYTGSLFITVMSFVSTIGSMFMSYFIYTIVLGFNYFPFMNLSALLMMVGLSADNVLVYYTAWSDYVDDDKRLFIGLQSSYNIRYRVGIITKTTLQHVAWSLMVTGFTTATAFFANFSSKVTAIKCFGVYTGLTVIMNLLLSLSFLPAVVVLQYKHLTYSYAKCFPFRYCTFLHKTCSKLCGTLSEISRIFFHQIQVLIIVRLRYFWVLFLFFLAAGGIVVVFVHPRFKLPRTSSYFQYFKPSHPFEAYAGEIENFAFQNQSVGNFPIRVIFGTWPMDSGDPRDPFNTGELSHQPGFNPSHPDSQEWLLNFCQVLRNTTYYRKGSDARSYSACFIETLKKWIEMRECAIDGVCCRERRFPYNSSVFKHCLKEAVYQLSAIPAVRLYPSTPGPRFDAEDNIRVVVIELDSTLPLTSSFDEVGRFYNDMEAILEPILESAPTGLRGGWFISDLRFYALQDALYKGMTSSVGWSLLAALLVILITSRNVTVSILACLSIAGIIFVTSACLVLLGWELNVLESVTISIAVGLSVDFTAHFAIAYMVAMPTDDRLQRVEFCVARMGPAITLAAITSIAAGVGMCPAQVLAYARFGIFLVIVMSVSWIYSSYFFLGLLSICGPQDNSCTLQCRNTYNVTPQNTKRLRGAD